MRLLLLILIFCLNKASEACHTTTVHIENGTWLDTSRWLQEGLLDNLDRYPLPSQNIPPTLEREEPEEVEQNKALPNFPVIPNKKQDCFCGSTATVRQTFFFFHPANELFGLR